MQVVSQILSQSPGRTEQREYGIDDLAAALTNNSGQRKHVTLYPGDYASEWKNQAQIPIPKNVSVTLLPGAIVEYETNFRNQDYNYDGDVIEATNANGDPTHPLSDPNSARYVSPDFTGHVENISDLNLASEWAFKQEFERALWTVRNADNQNTVDVPHKGIFEIRTDDTIDITLGEVQGIEDGPYVEINHADIYTSDDSVQEDTSKVVQNLEIEKGHIENVNIVEVVEQLESTGNIINLSDNKGKIEINHGGTGKKVMTVPDGNAVLDFETDSKGHVENIIHGANVKKVHAGRAIQRVQLNPGEFEIAHEEISIAGSPQNSGATLIQSIQPYVTPDNNETGHIRNVNALDIVEGSNITISVNNQNLIINTEPTVETRAPNQNEGEDGDIWLVEE